MAGSITISTLNNDTGVLATQNGMNGIAKAWVNFNGIGTVTIRTSFNVSSVTRILTGDYTVNFTTAMPNADYVAVFMGGGGYSGVTFPAYGTLSTDSSTTPLVKTASAVRYVNFQSYPPSPGSLDLSQSGLAIFSS